MKKYTAFLDNNYYNNTTAFLIFIFWGAQKITFKKKIQRFLHAKKLLSLLYKSVLQNLLYRFCSKNLLANVDKNLA